MSARAFSRAVASWALLWAVVWGPGTAMAQSCSRCGDVNGDGEANIVDALFIAQESVGLRAGVPCAGARDVQGDGSVDIVDALFIAQHTVGARPFLCFRLSTPAPFTLFNQSPKTFTGLLTGPGTVSCNGVPATSSSNGFSATVPLREGTTVVSCVARNDGGRAETLTTSVILDTTPPRVVIGTPADGAVLTENSVVVTGIVNDVVTGTVNGGDVQVSCNGVPAEVVNRSFVAANVPLVPGANTLRCTGVDRAGNERQASVSVTLDTSSRASISKVSGDLQAGAIGTTLPQPLVVAVTDDSGAPVPHRTVIFKVVENDGTVGGGGMSGRSVAVLTDASGQARAQFTLGTRAGAGSNEVEATAVGFRGTALFCASSGSGSAAHIVVDAWNNQFGVVAQPLPRPFIATVIDDGNNRLPNVPVTFTVTEGGGSFSGQPSLTVQTDSDGRAFGLLTLGSNPGLDNNVVSANFPGSSGSPAVFVASGRKPANPASTRVSGVVLDNTDAPVPGVTVFIAGTSLSTRSDEQGQFALEGAPVGHVFLVVDGSTVQRPGTWPNLDFEMVLVAGDDNKVGRGPIHLLPLEIPGGTPGGNKVCVDETRGGTITVDEVPGFSLTILPGSATFPNGSKRGCVTATPVHPDKAPMSPNFGQQPRFVVTIQPAGTLFDPPAPLSIPNAEILPPGQKTDMYSFDHDLGQFVSIGPGTVSDDGTVIRSDPGIGVIKAGWHCGGNPAGNGTCNHECDDGNPCTTDSFTGGACQHQGPMNPKTDAECCATVAFGGGYVVCCNGSRVACAAAGFYGRPDMGILARCVIEHESQHFGDITCPDGPNACDTSRPPFRPGRTQAEGECDASRVEVACLQGANCGGDAACQSDVDGRIAQVKAYGNSNKPGCFP